MAAAALRLAEPAICERPWPPDYVAEFAARQRRLRVIRADDTGAMLLGAREFYKQDYKAFINHWGVTYDPRNAGVEGKLTTMPFVTFPKQDELLDFLWECFSAEADGLDEKCRDMGATWVCVGFSVWLWLFWGEVAIGWGSRKEEYVDELGVIDSIFEKIRVFIRNLPREFLPEGFDTRQHMTFMKIVNPETGAVITGEVGDNIGRGGRTRMYFKDESAHYVHPEMTEAALGDNTNCQFDISSVTGPGTVFHRKREAGLLWQPGQRCKRGRTNVFVSDWRDHPAKDQAWYDQRRKKAVDEGMLHVFEQEVNRNYYAAVQGVIVNAEHLKACVGAHLHPALRKAGWTDGPWHGALDVADSLEGSVGDRNAGAYRKGVVLTELYEWAELDVGKTTRRAVAMCTSKGPMQFDYDSIGMGSAVKAERNRLEEEDLMPAGVRFTPWDAGAAPRGAELDENDPRARVNIGDKDSPLVKDYFHNLKAQGWWELAQRAHRTWQCVQAGRLLYSVDELMSIDPGLPLLLQMEKEVCQPTRGLSGSMKMLVNKTPEGTRSPNLGDAVMMCFWPAKGRSVMKITDDVLSRTRRRPVVVR